VKEGFMSDNTVCLFLKRGLRGAVRRIDDDGDALIQFDGIKALQWVKRKKFRCLEKDRPKLTPKRRTVWERSVTRNVAWEEKLRGIYGLASPAPRVSGIGNAEIKSLRDDAAQIAVLRQELYARENGIDLSPAREISTRMVSRGYIPVMVEYHDVPDEHELDESSSACSSERCRARWNMPRFKPRVKAPMPCKHTIPSCWSPFSRHPGGRYSNSPGPPNGGTKDDLDMLSYISLQSADGRAVRIHTPDPDHCSRTMRQFRWKPWVHCTASPR